MSAPTSPSDSADVATRRRRRWWAWLTAVVSSSPAGPGTAALIDAHDRARCASVFPSAAARPTSAMIACTSTSEVTNASDRAWLNPSATRSRIERVAGASSDGRRCAQRLARVVPRRAPTSPGRPASRCSCGCRPRGRRRVIAAGSTLIFELLASSCGRRRRARTAALRRGGCRSAARSSSCTNGDCSASPERGASERAGPLPSALGGDDAELEQAVVGRARPRTRSMPPRTVPTLPTSTQLASPSNHCSPSTSDARAERAPPARFLAPVQT